MPGAGNGYRLTPAAAADLEDIWTFTVSRWSADQADSYVRSIVNVIRSIADGDLSGRDISDLRPGYFRAAAGSHFIFYRVAESEIHVTRVLHKRMDHLRHF